MKPQKFHQSGRKPFQAVKKLPFLESPSSTTYGFESSRSNRWQAVEAPFRSTISTTHQNYSLARSFPDANSSLRLKLWCHTKLIQQRWYFFLPQEKLKLPTAPELLWILGHVADPGAPGFWCTLNFCAHGSPRTGICHVSKLVGIVLLQVGGYVGLVFKALM